MKALERELPVPGLAAQPSSPPLRVVQVVTSLLVGGMEQFVLRMASEQQARGHRVRVLSLRGGPLQSEARSRGLDTTVLGEGGKASRLAETLRFYSRFRPHVAHAHNPGALPYALLARPFGARVVMTRHGQLADWQPGPLEQRCTDAVVAVSGAAAETLRERRPEFTDRLSVILNGVQFEEAARPRSAVRKALGVDGVVGVTVARLDRLKGHDVLLKAQARLPERLPLTLLIAGDGPERARLEALRDELRLGDRVRFLGYRTDVPDLLAASDLFVLPSRTEGLPLSVLEAMSHGLPTIATPVGGVPEALNHEECGVLIPVDDVHRLAAALEALGSDAARRSRLGEAAQARVRRHFSFDAMTDQYEALYRRLLGIKRCAS